MLLGELSQRKTPWIIVLSLLMGLGTVSPWEIHAAGVTCHIVMNNLTDCGDPSMI